MRAVRCPTCGADPGEGPARWCGHCGAALSSPEPRQETSNRAPNGSYPPSRDGPQRRDGVWVGASPSRRGGRRAPAVAVAVAVVAVAAFALPRVGLPRDATVAVPEPPGDASTGAAGATATGRGEGGRRQGGGGSTGGSRLPTVELEDGTTIVLHPRDGLPAQVHRDVVTGVRSRGAPLPSMWSTPLAGRPTRPVPVGSGVVVRTTAEIALLDPGDGTVRWRRPLSGPLTPGDVPLVVDDLVVVGVPGGVLAVEAEAGGTVWETSLGTLDAYGLPVPVAASRGTVAVVVPGGGVVGIAAADGAVRWRTGPRGGLRDVPAADSARVYVLSRGDLVATEIATGATAWRREGGFTGVASAGRQLLVVAGERVLGIDPATGEVRWSRPGVAPPHGRLAVADPVAVLPRLTSAAGTTLVGYRLEDGAPHRSLSLPDPTRVEPLGQRLLVTSGRRVVRVVDPASWSVVAQVEVDDPVVAGKAHGDRLVLVTLDGQATRVRGFGPVP